MNKKEQKHGVYWVVQAGQQTSGVYLGYGCQVPETIGGIEYNIPLKTTERMLPDGEGEATEAIRYFSRVRG